jgi:hypothetical protein
MAAPFTLIMHRRRLPSAYLGRCGNTLSSEWRLLAEAFALQCPARTRPPPKRLVGQRPSSNSKMTAPLSLWPSSMPPSARSACHPLALREPINPPNRRAGIRVVWDGQRRAAIPSRCCT